MATGDERVVTAKLPADLVARLDDIARSIERSKSWIIREALRDWLAEEERRHELTKEAMRDFDEGRVVSHEDVLAMLALKKIQARTKD
jgi:predicted transcriptional regulator